MRHFFILLHRYVGILLLPFLIIVGLTGSTLAFYQELDRWLNPMLLTVPVPESMPGSMDKTPSFDLFTLRDQIERHHPHARVDWLSLHYEADQAYRFFLLPQMNPETGQAFELPHNEIYFNRYTGEQIGARHWGTASLTKENIMSFMYRLHYTLALPEHIAIFGVYILGIVALLWFLDCFVGFYLTLPPRKKQAQHTTISSNACQHTTQFWQRWKPAWQIKISRFIYDLHRSGGLWLWSILFIIAWSGVALNLKEVYHPVMSAVFNMRDVDALPKLDTPLVTPGLDMRAAHQRGQQIIQTAATHFGFIVENEQFLSLDRVHGVYHYRVKNNQDSGKYGATIATFNANTGELKLLTLPATDSVGDVINRWIIELHTARVFGLPMQILICITGLIVTMLSISGAVIWLKKRKAKKMLITKARVNKEMITEPSSL